jgi:lysophospholipase L1-like esterase
LALRLAAATLAIAASLASMELVLRLTWDRPSGPLIRSEVWRFTRPDPEFGCLPKPDTTVAYPRYGATFQTNSFGLRGPELSLAKPPGVRRIVVLGDSFAWGHGVGEGQAFPELLEQLLPNTQVVNLGVPGFNVRTEHRYFEQLGAGFDPDLVLLALSQNDIHDLDAFEQQQARNKAEQTGNQGRSPAGPEDPPELSNPLRSFKRFLDDHSYVYALCRQSINSHKVLARTAVRLGLKEELAGFDLLDDNLHASMIKPPPPVVRAYEQLERDLLRVDQCVRSRGARLIIAMIPSIQAVDRRELVLSLAYTHYEPVDFDTDLPHRRVRAFAAEHGIQVIDPLEQFRAASNRGRRLYLTGDLHFNPAGHRLFAEVVSAALPPTDADPPTAADGRP